MQSLHQHETLSNLPRNHIFPSSPQGVPRFMDISQSNSGSEEALTAIGHRICHSFTSLIINSSALETEYGFHAALVNESQRFGLWAKNIGLYDSGHSSLDYRFRDAPSTFEYARQLLVDLKKSLSLSTCSSPSFEGSRSVCQNTHFSQSKTT